MAQKKIKTKKLSLLQTPQYEYFFRKSLEALFVLDLNFNIIDLSNSAIKLIDNDSVQLTGKSIYDFFVIPNNLEPGLHEEVACRIINEKAQDFIFDISVQKIDGFIFCSFRDVSEKSQLARNLVEKHIELKNAYLLVEKANVEIKNAQETLIQAGKLAALGELSAGIAHELNQPLTAIHGFAQETYDLLKKNSFQDLDRKSAISFLEEMLKASVKMDKIISHLRNFARKSTEDFKLVSLSSVVDDALMMLDKQFKTRAIVVDRDYQEQLPQIYCNPFQLEQVFINLATNARDAIEMNPATKNNGRIGVKIFVSDDADFVEVHFSDNGCGINEKYKSKIFNPFFTTKEVGRGMGLGLSISYGILSKLNASVMIESKAGHGTIFKIKIPIDYRKH